jgi:hypothetical protein
MNEVPDSLFEPTFGPKTTEEWTLPDDWSPSNLGDSDEDPDWDLRHAVDAKRLTAVGKIERGNRLRKETYTECGFMPREVAGSPGKQKETQIAILANGCIAYSIRYRCIVNNVYYWIASPADIKVYDAIQFTRYEYRTVVVCNNTVAKDPPPVWLPPSRQEATPRQATSTRENGNDVITYRDTYWELVLPVHMTSRCTGVAHYRKMVHVEKYLAPDMVMWGTASEEDALPPQTKDEPFQIPGCLESQASVPASGQSLPTDPLQQAQRSE